MITGFRVVLPPPWERINLSGDYKAHVGWIMDRSAHRVRLASEMPPDSIAKVRARLEGKLLSDLERIRDNGGTDYFLPTDLMHGVAINANFTVSDVVPDSTIKAEEVPQVFASMTRDGTRRPKTIDDTLWLRSESVLKGEPRNGDDGTVDARKVEYLTALPDDPRHWKIVTFTSAGDGDPDSPPTHLTVQLFDAIMGTWRWTPVSPHQALAPRKAGRGDPS